MKQQLRAYCFQSLIQQVQDPGLLPLASNHFLHIVSEDIQSTPLPTCPHQREVFASFVKLRTKNQDHKNQISSKFEEPSSKKIPNFNSKRFRNSEITMLEDAQ